MGRYRWSLTPDEGELDLPSVLLHELGHSLGLHHCARLCSREAVMQEAIPTGVRRRSLTASDLTAIFELYAPHDSIRSWR